MRAITPLSLATAVLIALPASTAASGPPVEPDHPAQPGVTLTSTGLARLKPPARLSERSIRKAFDAAHRTAVQRAINQVLERSDAIARAAGLSLGEIVDVIDADPPYFQEFGAERFCKPRRRRRCRAPEFAAAAVRVTSSLRSAATAERTVTARGEGEAPVKPRNRRSSLSIRHAVLRARVEAGPAAVREGRERAERLASSAGLTLGPLLGVSDGDDFFNPYGSDTFGSFGIGRYCGRFRRAILRRVPGTRRFKVVGHRRSRRTCRVPRTDGVSLHLSFAASG